ncbi:MAG TPA: wax ester/triacylglycerol synthase family O-acyltransferase [Gordonia sp. (in: high G+C Gram-positive bacteria)]|uniref:wax ester/triacylglycerol synthase domain-containing protein n=1 Tax=unclassified Gordonia (in: high G+C Gram-positive bacteria) TaxID=2657482 RepID=UPI000F938588|nr:MULTISPECIES: wax ester/triacylglycerol synthase domain-containing protein [unclassified Gordonia (in: high G+C Gram-positive bacteria)]RUP36782.1 MAG: hypothetical protein EKK60_14155 [Gordonia sp. (in: high G+C Gram-positive bacteria)]HNP56976.1 wax ester/triacylglycerol synthase family O-acyltransferase [Gordonia sp. (in: high G+C Gram-positive bacteria)]HRC50420.1 wax ester/triacylglycerol synthase family O-acyltransferase [Gordonia sp. (in: high G+C Gram-positive bacteria)]
MTRLTPVDARMLWAAPAAHSDQFLLYAFDETEASADAVRAQVLARAADIPRCNVAVREVPGHLDYPAWGHSAVAGDQVVIHRLADRSWTGLLEEIGVLLADQVDPREHPWRLHLFDGVAPPPGIPGAAARVRAAVLQVSHALADGRGASELARQLFGGSPADPTTAGPSTRLIPTPLRALGGLVRLPVQIAGLVVGGVRSYARSRGEDPDGLGPVAPASINCTPGPRRVLRTLTVERSVFPGRVTPSAIAAIGDALASAGLVDGDPVVELTVGRGAANGGRPANDFFMAGIATRTDLPDEARRRVIVEQIDAARARDGARDRVAARRAEDATPAVLMHWATTGFASPVADAVTGHSVVSSVNRGAADLFLAGGRVRLTAGFPALSAVHALTHGVHGIGDAVTVSVLADPDVVDVAAYLPVLAEAIARGPADRG